MTQFTDRSTATRLEKAKRVLRVLASQHSYKYFYDGRELQQDATATLEVLETLEAAADHRASLPKPK